MQRRQYQNEASIQEKNSLSKQFLKFFRKVKVESNDKQLSKIKEPIVDPLGIHTIEWSEKVKETQRKAEEAKRIWETKRTQLIQKKNEELTANKEGEIHEETKALGVLKDKTEEESKDIKMLNSSVGLKVSEQQKPIDICKESITDKSNEFIQPTLKKQSPSNINKDNAMSSTIGTLQISGKKIFEKISKIQSPKNSHALGSSIHTLKESSSQILEKFFKKSSSEPNTSK